MLSRPGYQHFDSSYFTDSETFPAGSLYRHYFTMILSGRDNHTTTADVNYCIHVNGKVFVVAVRLLQSLLGRERAREGCADGDWLQAAQSLRHHRQRDRQPRFETVHDRTSRHRVKRSEQVSIKFPQRVR